MLNNYSGITPEMLERADKLVQFRAEGLSPISSEKPEKYKVEPPLKAKPTSRNLTSMKFNSVVTIRRNENRRSSIISSMIDFVDNYEQQSTQSVIENFRKTDKQKKNLEILQILNKPIKKNKPKIQDLKQIREMRHSIYDDMREGKPMDPSSETHLNDLRNYQGGSPPMKLLRKSIQDNCSSASKEF